MWQDSISKVVPLSSEKQNVKADFLLKSATLAGQRVHSKISTKGRWNKSDFTSEFMGNKKQNAPK